MARASPGTRISGETIKRCAKPRLQARYVQALEIVEEGELLLRKPERGFARLPTPSAGDMFFDIEGAPFVGTGGLEYLLGWVVLADGATAYRSRWAVNAAEERMAFEAFIDEVMERRVGEILELAHVC